jgi:serine phosphatase RsbU (regulator of sigma subunit)
MPILKLPPDCADRRLFHFEKTAVVGRGRGVDLSLRDPSVSRHHARIECTADGCSIVDLDSANGTLLNGRPVQARLSLADGDRLSFGVIDAVFSLGPPPADRPAGGTNPGARPAAPHPAPSSSRAAFDPPTTTGHLGLAGSFYFKLAQITSGRFEIDAVLSFVVAGVFALVPRAGRVAIATPEDGAGQLRLRIARTRFGKTADLDPEAVLAAARHEGFRGSQPAPGDASAAAGPPRSIGGRSTIVVPLVFDGRSFGVLLVDDGGSGAALRRSDASLLRAIALPVVQAIAYHQQGAARHRHSLLEHDLQLARKIQQQFLPERVPEIERFEMTVAYLPALGVGGDFYDFLRLGDGRTGVVIGDVAGKGVSAALYAARVSSDLRYLAPKDNDPAAILSELDDRVSSLAQDGMFVTAALAILDAGTGRLSVASAGHPLPLLKGGDGVLRPLGARGGVPLGIGRARPYVSEYCELRPGDVVFFYTDGVFDAANANGDPFGQARFEAAIRRPHASAAELQQRLLAALNDFVGDRPRFDDITVICLRHHETARRHSSAASRAPGRRDE